MMMSQQPKLLPTNSKTARLIRRFLRLLGVIALLAAVMLGLLQLLFSLSQ